MSFQLSRRGGSNKRPRPDDFLEVYNRLGVRATREHYRCSFTALNRWLGELAIPRARTIKVPEFSYDKILSVLVESNTLTEAASKLDVSPRVLSRRMAENGLTWEKGEVYEQDETEADPWMVARGARMVYLDAALEPTSEPLQRMSEWASLAREADLGFIRNAYRAVGWEMTEDEEDQILQALGKVRSAVLDGMTRRVKENSDEA